jgi:hypothetical protein
MTTVLRRAPDLPPGRRSIDLDRIQWRIIDALDEPLTLTALIENTGVGAFRLFDEVARLLDERVVVPDADAAPIDRRPG